MSTYYIRKTGSDSNGGTSAALAWLTIGKALGASGIASGDTVYVGAGTYREVVTVAMTSATVNTSIIGDVDGVQTGDPGDVIWTGYTTNDSTAPSTSSLCNLAGRDFLTFQKLIMIGSNADASCINAYTTHSISITIKDCILYGSTGGPIVAYTSTAQIAANWTIERCILFSLYYYSIFVQLTTIGTGSDYDSNFAIRNCIIHVNADTAVRVSPSGALSKKGGGVDLYNSTILGGEAMRTDTNISTTVASIVNNCIIVSGRGYGINAATAGQVTEDYNVIHAATGNLNVTAGTNSIASMARAPMINVGQEWIIGGFPKMFAAPLAGSPYLGFGNTAVTVSEDILNRTRPSGGASTTKGIGAIERHDAWVKETSTVRTGSNAISCIGPGDHDFQIPVDATSTTVSVYMRYDTTHATTNKPQMQVVNCEECGVTSATATMTVGVDTWEQISLTFTPTRQGVVTIRLISRSAGGAGKAFADDFSIT